MEYVRLPNGLEIAHLNRGETDFLYREIFERESYFQHGITIKDGDIVFDVGANIGMLALFVHQRCRGAQVFAFEPIPAVFEVLSINVETHGLNARLFRCGLGDVTSEMAFTYYPKMSLMSGAYADASEDERVTRAFMINVDPRTEKFAKALLRGKFEGERVECELRRLSDIVLENAVDRIDLLKIDVEKSELDVLGGVDESDWKKIRQLVVEVHDIDGRLSFVAGMLEQRGFQVTVEQDLALRGTELFNV